MVPVVGGRKERSDGIEIVAHKRQSRHVIS